MFLDVVLLYPQYSIDLLNLCRCCPVISTVQHRSVKCLYVLSCYLNSTVLICYVFVGVVMLSQQYSIYLLNVCMCCSVISTLQYRSVKCL